MDKWDTKPSRLLGGTEWFADRFRAACGGLIADRQIVIKTDHGGLGDNDTVYVSFFNLPQGKSIDGAQGMNNRMMFAVRGFAKDGGESPSGKVQVEMMTSALPREYKLRAKSGRATDIAVYLAEFLRMIERTVNPKIEKW